MSEFLEALAAKKQKMSEENDSAVAEKSSAQQFVIDFVGLLREHNVPTTRIGRYRDDGVSNPLTGRRLAKFLPTFSGWILHSGTSGERTCVVVKYSGEVVTGPPIWFVMPANGPLVSEPDYLRFTGFKTMTDLSPFAVESSPKKGFDLGYVSLWAPAMDTSKYEDMMTTFAASRIKGLSLDKID